MTSPAARWAPPALAVALVAATGATAAVADHPHLRRDRGFAVVAPADGASVGTGFLLAWSASRHRSMSFAVLVDHTPPPPGYMISPGPSTMLVRGTAIRMTLGPRIGGSPSARHFHQVVVVPVDDNGYRIGENVALVHVRDRT